VRPVNLLPTEYRPRRKGALSGGSYVLVGGLFVMLVLAGLYILTANKVTSRENERAEALQQTQVAEARIAALGAYGDFATIAETRKASVEQLARGRFDWERFTRELSYVLPKGVWLTEVDASVVPDTATGPAPSQPAPTGPSAKISGCAKSQDDVARLMVRLRQMHRVDDVQLKESARASESGSSSSSSATTSGAEGCGNFYAFELTTVFEETAPVTAPPGQGTARVPARLGGGE